MCQVKPGWYPGLKFKWGRNQTAVKLNICKINGEYQIFKEIKITSYKQ